MANLTQYAIDAVTRATETGFTANPHIPTSPAWYAHELGLYLLKTGRSFPRDVRMSRGYSIWGNDMLFKIHDQKQSISFERVK